MALEWNEHVRYSNLAGAPAVGSEPCTSLGSLSGTSPDPSAPATGVGCDAGVIAVVDAEADASCSIDEGSLKVNTCESEREDK